MRHVHPYRVRRVYAESTPPCMQHTTGLTTEWHQPIRTRSCGYLVHLIRGFLYSNKRDPWCEGMCVSGVHRHNRDRGSYTGTHAISNGSAGACTQCTSDMVQAHGQCEQSRPLIATCLRNAQMGVVHVVTGSSVVPSKVRVSCAVTSGLARVLYVTARCADVCS